MDSVENLNDLEDHAFPEESVVHIRKVFDSCDNLKIGKIKTQALSVIFTAIGVRITTSELERLIVKIIGQGYNELTFNNFLKLLWYRVRLDLQAKETLEAFRFFDPESKGFITVSQIRSIFCELELDLTNAEIEALIREVDAVHDGVFDYTKFVHKSIYEH